MMNSSPLNVLITGADGFIAKNIGAHLRENKLYTVLPYRRSGDASELCSLVEQSEIILHLAGVNRPADPLQFQMCNIDLTAEIVSRIIKCYKETGERKKLIFSSSIQAAQNSEYGKSKLQAEELVKSLSSYNIPYCILRLPGVFGKWSRPNYNSVVATFCYNVINDIPLFISDPKKSIDLIYIDDLVKDITSLMAGPLSNNCDYDPSSLYSITLGDLGRYIELFHETRKRQSTCNVSQGLERALYATYLSFLRIDMFTMPIKASSDPRGRFVEFIKSSSGGQVSYFTANAGKTRGCHYHHTKSERFLVVHGTAKFEFQNISTSEQFQVTVRSDDPAIVDSVPGWAHKVTNIGSDTLVVMVWANESFDPRSPDTFPFQF